MSALDLSLYLVLDPDLCGGADGMVRTAQRAARHGATVVQLRAPHWKKRQWYETGLALKAALAPYGVPLIVNDHVDVAIAIDAAGVHVGQGDLPVPQARRLLGPGKWLGLSISSEAELAQAVLTGVDYLGIGPVHATATKTDAAPACGVAGFAAMRRGCSLPVVAIGGIQADNCAALISAGADGVAVVSAICGQREPGEATQALAARIRAAR